MTTKFISPQDPTVDIFQGRPAYQYHLTGHLTGMLLPDIRLTYDSGLFSFKTELDCWCDGLGFQGWSGTCSVDYYHPRSVSEEIVDYWVKTGSFMWEEDD